MRLTQQEPGVGGNRPGRLLGQSGEQFLRIGRSPQGTISQRQLVTRVMEHGGGSGGTVVSAAAPAGLRSASSTVTAAR